MHPVTAARQPGQAPGDAGASPPTVSVLIPCYNTARYVAETLDSLFAQSFGDFEAIVINDGSPDTEELERALLPFRDRIVYLKQENRGLAGARNAGLRVARGRYVALLDSDDLWEPEYLAVHVAALDADPSLDVVFPDATIFGETADAGKSVMQLQPLEGEITFERLVSQDCYVWGGVTARRERVIEAGLFDESLRSSEDYDMWLRILRRGGRIGYHRRPLARYRKRDGSLSANVGRMLDHHLLVWDKLLATFGLTAREQEMVHAQRRRTLATMQLTRGRAAFFARDFATARAALREANRFFRSPKLRATIAALQVAPGLTLALYELRDSLVYRRSTKH